MQPWLFFVVPILAVLVPAQSLAQKPLPSPPACNIPFKDAFQANTCKETSAPGVADRINSFAAQLATFYLEVGIRGPAPAAGQLPSYTRIGQGTAFLVHRERGLFLTSKHVLLGEKIWDTVPDLKIGDFTDFESAVEEYLSRAEISAYPSYWFTNAVPLRLVAFDRNTDLVLLQALDPSMGHLNFAPLSIFQAVQLARDYECKTDRGIIAFGYSDDKTRALEYVEGVVFDCNILAQTALIGGRKFRFPLLRAKLGTSPGMSGGPVLNERWELIGVIAGGVVDKKFSYFVPVSAVSAFLNRFTAIARTR